MPWRDGTGPRGQGRLTGRGFGPCGGMGFGSGGWGKGFWVGNRMGFGFGRGLGRGFGWGFATYAPPYPTNVPQLTKKDELAELKEYAKNLEAELSEIKKRIVDLGK